MILVTLAAYFLELAIAASASSTPDSYQLQRPRGVNHETIPHEQPLELFEAEVEHRHLFISPEVIENDLIRGSIYAVIVGFVLMMAFPVFFMGICRRVSNCFTSMCCISSRDDSVSFEDTEFVTPYEPEVV